MIRELKKTRKLSVNVQDFDISAEALQPCSTGREQGTDEDSWYRHEDAFGKELTFSHSSHRIQIEVSRQHRLFLKQD